MGAAISKRISCGSAVSMALRRRSGGVGKRRPGPEAVEAALKEAAELFPKRSAELPPLVLRHQLYGLAGDRTAVDRHLNRLQADGRVRLLHLGLGPDTVAVVGAEEYRETVLRAVEGSPHAPLVRRFLDGVRPLLSFERGQLEEMGLRDSDVTQLVAAGVLTVRDAGSWWLALPGAGRFIRALLRGRKQLLAAVRRSRHREVLQAELGQRRARPSLGLRYVLLDLLGAELLRSVPTTSGPLLRLAET